MDRWQGDGQAVDGETRTAFTAASEGYARFGFDVPTERIPDRSDQAMHPGVLRGAQYVYGSLSTDRVLAVSFEAESESAATDIREFLVAATSMARGRLGDGAGVSRQQRLAGLLEETTVSRSQRTVVVRTERGGEAVVLVLAAVVGSFVLGIGQQQAERTPQAAFETEYDRETRELTITHTAGDSVVAEHLFIRGENVPTRRWDRLGGSASGDQGGRPAVVAGDRLTLSEVSPDYQVSVVWASGDRHTVVLFESEGPEA